MYCILTLSHYLFLFLFVFSLLYRQFHECIQTRDVSQTKHFYSNMCLSESRSSNSRTNTSDVRTTVSSANVWTSKVFKQFDVYKNCCKILFNIFWSKNQKKKNPKELVWISNCLNASDIRKLGLTNVFRASEPLLSARQTSNFASAWHLWISDKICHRGLRFW